MCTFAWHEHSVLGQFHDLAQAQEFLVILLWAATVNLEKEK